MIVCVGSVLRCPENRPCGLCVRRPRASRPAAPSCLRQSPGIFQSVSPTPGGAAIHNVDGDTPNPYEAATTATSSYPAVHNVDSSFG
jgi:hypothetical protein